MFQRLAAAVLEGSRSHLLILLGDSGAGKTFTTTGPDGLIPTVFGRVLTGFRLDNYNIGGHRIRPRSEKLLCIRSGDNFSIGSNW